MASAPPPRARRILTAIAATVLAGALIALLFGPATLAVMLIGAVIPTPTLLYILIIRHFGNRRSSLDAEWARIADDWRRRYL